MDVPAKVLKEGFQQARRITKKFAKTFYLASLLLPAEKKYASYAIYALCRLSDEAVDNSSSADPEGALRKLSEKIALACGREEIKDPLLAAFGCTVKACGIPEDYFKILLDGMRKDLSVKRYADFPSLYAYCWQAAGVVGLMMLKIIGSRDKAAQAYAVKLGVAMQLTNILRDIREDLDRGRIYLPLDEMCSFGISESQLANGINDEKFKEFMRFQVRRAMKFYTESLPGIRLIDNRRGRLLVLAMLENYRLILEAVRKNNYDVFNRRTQVCKWKKIAVILKILLRGEYL